jgi:hypothetical protein
MCFVEKVVGRMTLSFLEIDDTNDKRFRTRATICKQQCIVGARSDALVWDMGQAGDDYIRRNDALSTVG